ncbi:unnamed protein product, partial [Prorocentrum cordatum]
MAKGGNGWLRNAWACAAKRCSCKDNFEWRTECYLCGAPKPKDEQRVWLGLSDEEFRSLSGVLTQSQRDKLLHRRAMAESGLAQPAWDAWQASQDVSSLSNQLLGARGRLQKLEQAATDIMVQVADQREAVRGLEEEYAAARARASVALAPGAAQLGPEVRAAQSAFGQARAAVGGDAPPAVAALVEACERFLGAVVGAAAGAGAAPGMGAGPVERADAEPARGASPAAVRQPHSPGGGQEVAAALCRQTQEFAAASGHPGGQAWDAAGADDSDSDECSRRPLGALPAPTLRGAATPAGPGRGGSHHLELDSGTSSDEVGQKLGAPFDCPVSACEAASVDPAGATSRPNPLSDRQEVRREREAGDGPTASSASPKCWKLCTCNTTSWSSVQWFLENECDADVVMLQEVAIAPELQPDREAAVGRLGWKAKVAPSRDTGGGLSGGALVGTWPHIGLCEAPVPKRPWPSERVLLMWVNGLVPGGFIAGSVYLVSGGGLDDQSFLILKQLGEALRAMGQPFILGGDWNV